MADGDDERDEEWFKEVYGREYTGPPRAPRDNPREGGGKVTKKRSTGNASASAGESEDEDEARDPNAVPTDFTSREAKVWEAKAKAVERNWKRRKEEELTCRICGEVGHFAQGCPTTLGGNPRKPGEVVERINLRDKRLRPRLIGTGGTVIQNIEKDTGCRLKLEDNLTVGHGAFFVKITGPDKHSVSKAADAVNKLVDQVEDEWKQQNTRRSQGSFRGSSVNPLIAAQMQHIAVQRLQHSPGVSSGPGRGEGPPPLDEDKRTIEHIASQLEARRHWEAVSGSSQGLNGSGSSPSFSYKEGRGASGAGSIPPQFAVKGSGTPALDGAAYYHGSNQESGPFQGGNPTQEQEQDMDLGYEEQPLPQSLEELEQRFLQETIDLTKDQNVEEDKENVRHREHMRDIQEQYQQKMTTLRNKHAKQREDYLRHEAQLRQQQYQQGPYFYSAGGALPSGRSLSNFNGGSYDLRNHLSGSDGPAYDSYKDGLSHLSGHSFSRKGFDSGKGYSGNQGYDSSYYGSSQAYQSYG